MIERSVLDIGARYRLLKLLEANPEASQRTIARELGVSLGKVNYCLRAPEPILALQSHSLHHDSLI